MIHPYDVSYGSDPEFFLQRRDGSIIGSEKVIPPKGLAKDGSKVVRDGVQVEFNPRSSYARDGLFRSIGSCFSSLQTRLTKTPNISINYDGIVEVARAELDSLEPESRELGCQPSENVYGNHPITVDRQLYRKRSAGGHLHFGLSDYEFSLRTAMVPIFDMFVGNTGVLFDRDLGARERRENYGRAGEFRFQPHGVEYRTPSNFWTRSPILADLMCGMGAAAVSLITSDYRRNTKVEQELIDVVDIDTFITAINTNDFDMALSNLNVIRPFIVRHFSKHEFPIDQTNIDGLIRLAERVKAYGLAEVFPEDPVTAWTAPKFMTFRDFIKEY